MKVEEDVFYVQRVGPDWAAMLASLGITLEKRKVEQPLEAASAVFQRQILYRLLFSSII